jgi:hypothetical protein
MRSPAATGKIKGTTGSPESKTRMNECVAELTLNPSLPREGLVQPPLLFGKRRGRGMSSILAGIFQLLA